MKKVNLVSLAKPSCVLRYNAPLQGISKMANIKHSAKGLFSSWNLVVLLAFLSLNSVMVLADDNFPGITQPIAFPAFDPNAPFCSAPPGLTNTLAYVQENEREFLQGVDYGLAMAAKDRGLAYRNVVVENDVAKAISEIDAFRRDKVGALVATSSNPTAVSSNLQQVIWSGAYVGTIVPPPATLLLNAPQYATGKALTDAAVTHIKSKLGGKATVVLLTQDMMQYLSPRFEILDWLDNHL